MNSGTMNIAILCLAVSHITLQGVSESELKLTSLQQRGHTETDPRFNDSSEIPEKRGIDLAIS